MDIVLYHDISKFEVGSRIVFGKEHIGVRIYASVGSKLCRKSYSGEVFFFLLYIVVVCRDVTRVDSIHGITVHDTLRIAGYAELAHYPCTILLTGNCH